MRILSQFGWNEDSRALAHWSRSAAPVGESCLHCRQAIDDEACGYLIEMDGSHFDVPSDLPMAGAVHARCLIPLMDELVPPVADENYYD